MIYFIECFLNSAIKKLVIKNGYYLFKGKKKHASPYERKR